MNVILMFNRYLVPILFIILLASSLTGCYVLHHGHGHHFSHDNYHAQQGRHLHGGSREGHRAHKR